MALQILPELQEWLYFRKVARLKRKADKRKAVTKIPHYVIRWNGKLQVKSARFFKNMKKTKRLTKDFSWMKLQEMSVYTTN
jgi:hypothetical protein